ncbi:hypothetical protein FSP39_022288 [Pinctada imbricata]|uniref:G-protein coupled receptors family 1 profile domain-containing protein n=1 Tax=Pinctada imbricata TaxID=66713 RepID=A0AA88Y6Z6_PINIB|nr:hypothetical protein FSP39_022288 [Pinctada imbricata]
MDLTSQIYISLEVIIGVAAIFGNALVLVAVMKYPRLRTVTNFFIASLAIADLLVGIIVAPLAALSYLGLPRDYMGCVLTNSVLVMLTQISIFSLVGVAVERFIAIRNPFFYQTHMTTRVATIIIFVTWVVAILIGLVPVFGWNLGPMDDNVCAFVKVIDMRYMVYFNFFGFVLSPLIIMFLIYSYIFYIVRQQMTKIFALEVMGNSENKKVKSKFMREVKAAKSLAVVIGIFAVCWLPLHILNSITLICDDPSCAYHYTILLAAILLSHVNSAINPFLYAIGNSQFQIAFKRMFCGKNAVMSNDDDFTFATKSKPNQRKSSDSVTSKHDAAVTYDQNGRDNAGFDASDESMAGSTSENNSANENAKNGEIFYIR